MVNCHLVRFCPLGIFPTFSECVCHVPGTRRRLATSLAFRFAVIKGLEL